MYIWEVIRKSGQLENVESRVARMMFRGMLFYCSEGGGARGHEHSCRHSKSCDTIEAHPSRPEGGRGRFRSCWSGEAMSCVFVSLSHSLSLPLSFSISFNSMHYITDYTLWCVYIYMYIHMDPCFYFLWLFYFWVGRGERERHRERERQSQRVTERAGSSESST